AAVAMRPRLQPVTVHLARGPGAVVPRISGGREAAVRCIRAGVTQGAAISVEAELQAREGPHHRHRSRSASQERVVEGAQIELLLERRAAFRAQLEDLLLP